MNESMKDYIARIMNIHRKLEKGGHGFKDTELALIMLMGLPKTYEPMILNLEQNEEKLSTKIVKAKLLLEEKKQLRHDTTGEETTSKAFVIKEEKQPTFHERRKYHPAEKTQEASTSHNYQKNTQAKAVKCFCCGKVGHIAKNCRFNPAVKERFCFTENKEQAKRLLSNPDKISKQKAFFFREGNRESHLWYLDSGATEHMVSDRSKLTNIREISSVVETANKQSIHVMEMGDITFKVLNQQGELLATAPRNTYYIEEFNNSARITKVREDIWHRRLGHLNKEAVAKMNIGEKEVTTNAHNKDKRASYPLELIHSDVVGPINPRSKGGSNYFVTFIDDFSHYTAVYFMKNKNEVLEKFKEYKNFVENFHERRIKTLRSDNGKEYCNSEFDWLLIKNGIRRQLSVPRTPQKNGVSERMNQTLLSIARGLLTESGIPITFWGDAIHTACYLRNKSPSKAIDNKIPEELWSGRESKIGYLKVFGCKYWCSIDDCHRKSKFSPKAEECVLIGYPEGIKGYKREEDLQTKVKFGSTNNSEQETNKDERSQSLRRSERIKKKKKKNGEETKIKRDIMKNPQSSTEEPSTIEEALCGPEATNWSEAIPWELQGLKEKGAWEIVPRPVNKRVIDSRWVFKRKIDSYGNLREYRARLVACGFHQIPNVDFGKKYSPVVKHKSIRFLLALAVEREWNIFQMDKSIYGLKQSGHEWNEKLDQILSSIGLERSRMDPCVYFSKDIILGVYVDDLLVTTSSVESYVKFKSSIQGEVDIKDLGEVSDLLSVRIKRNKDSNLELDQTHYIEEILKEYGMEHAKEASTPLDPGMFTEGPGGKEACRAPYQQAIGNLLWLAGMTRPDIAYAVSYLSKFNSSPLQQHWNAVKHLLRYLKKTKDLKLVFSKTGKKLAAFADADWGSDKEDRKSYSGYIFVLDGAAISWCSRKQKCVALSTAEAEYYAMCEAAKEALWFTSFM
ncbi:hypothetical protein LAZ67_12000761 [Cordylochernes scorpioides]|uniref:Retrovirus-related Pol polyprotein from transposon TNT 1-94 n=1 Tax=Cordylochernes scorpioides TaxID=51811 RepID=A0ABY6L0T0_9ARAC|nr:hypothetical protein LAZ67_12000761 [Cordylochernes scorpioides]